ncbi:ATP-dependent nuclease [Agrobacterium cavarae]|uniref:ATP-dependent nuclease n=1 Tax=Agrobacterium cavarae TaxID=2528239 RepID=UPI00289E2547|nr:AAA family ATPase [Agrobacterium cavarae]
MSEHENHIAAKVPFIRLLTIKRFRGIEDLTWRPARGVNILLGGGDVGKTTILEAIALLLNPTNATALSDSDYWQREYDKGFEISATMSLPLATGIAEQRKAAWPWEWDGENPRLPALEAGDPAPAESVYCVRLTGTPDFELLYEICQPDDTYDHFSVAVRRKIGVVRLTGDDRNDRDLRLVQGSALERLLNDKSLRARLGQKVAESDVVEALREEAVEALDDLDDRFANRSLPNDLGLGLVGGPGFSLSALVGLTADKNGATLPLSSWGAGTRRLAALEVANARQVEHPIMVVDEIERGLESYRQRILVEELVTSPSQAFVTTHSAAAVSAAKGADLWYVDATSAIGRLPSSLAPQRERDPETFLARLAIIAEGKTEVGFVTELLTRAFGDDIRRYGVWVSDGGSNTETLAVLQALTKSRLAFGGFADDEGTDNTGWETVKSHLGDLLLRWKTGCLEANVIAHMPDEKLEEFIRDRDGDSGERLRTMADRLGLLDTSVGALRENAGDFRQLIIDAATGASHPEPEASKETKKAWKKHGQRWFKTRDGGRELAEKVFSFGIWPQLSGELLPFVNAVRRSVGLADIDTVA